jgi:hypothetical protein
VAPTLPPTPPPTPRPFPTPPPIPGLDDVRRRRPQSDLYAFGNRTKPRDPRIPGYNRGTGERGDLYMGSNGLVGPEYPPTPNGASTFGDPYQAPVSGHFHKIPQGIPLPEGLAVIADGSDVGGPHPPTHHTIYPTRAMFPQEFIDKFQSLLWTYAGYKP